MCSLMGSLTTVAMSVALRHVPYAIDPASLPRLFAPDSALYVATARFLAHATGVHARPHRHCGSGDVRARLRWARSTALTSSPILFIVAK